MEAHEFSEADACFDGPSDECAVDYASACQLTPIFRWHYATIDNIKPETTP
jgi:hypothetical protein